MTKSSNMILFEQLSELLFGSDGNISEHNDTLHNLFINQSNTTFHFNTQLYKRHGTAEITLLIMAYSVLGMVSVFGNTLVCYVICKNKRLYTATNFFLANLAISDLLVTFLNVPFNIARNLLDEWPFGNVLCHLVNFSLILSVYVSTYTLAVIALDRHRVVVEPFTPRMSKRRSLIIITGIWILAICLAMPYGFYTSVEEVDFFISTVRRCRSAYPSESVEKYLTLVTYMLQYCAPLTLIGIAYGKIVYKLWIRTHVGAVTEGQQISQAKSKRKSIKLLITVVIVFAVCWLPLNLYHILTDFHPDAQTFQYNSRVFFACHWLAVSSTCYNPFIYCWLNDSFRTEVMSKFHWCLGRCFGKYTFSDRLPCCNSRRRFLQEITRNATRTSLASSRRSTNTIKRDTSNSTDREDIGNVQVIFNAAGGSIHESLAIEDLTSIPVTGLLVTDALINIEEPLY